MKLTFRPALAPRLVARLADSAVALLAVLAATVVAVATVVAASPAT